MSISLMVYDFENREFREKVYGGEPLNVFYELFDDIIYKKAPFYFNNKEMLAEAKTLYDIGWLNVEYYSCEHLDVELNKIYTVGDCEFIEIDKLVEKLRKEIKMLEEVMEYGKEI